MAPAAAVLADEVARSCGVPGPCALETCARNLQQISAVVVTVTLCGEVRAIFYVRATVML
jgi:hypothetical protein